jgi:hypothetical protein
MADLASVRAEIDHARKLVDRQRRDILALQRAGISTPDAERVLTRQLARLDDLIGERNRLVAAQPNPMQGKVLGGRKWAEILRRRKGQRAGVPEGLGGAAPGRRA